MVDDAAAPGRPARARGEETALLEAIRAFFQTKMTSTCTASGRDVPLT
jgi:hypothetical protein